MATPARSKTSQVDTRARAAKRASNYRKRKVAADPYFRSHDNARHVITRHLKWLPARRDLSPPVEADPETARALRSSSRSRQEEHLARAVEIFGAASRSGIDAAANLYEALRRDDSPGAAILRSDCLGIFRNGGQRGEFSTTTLEIATSYALECERILITFGEWERLAKAFAARAALLSHKIDTSSTIRTEHLKTARQLARDSQTLALGRCSVKPWSVIWVAAMFEGRAERELSAPPGQVRQTFEKLARYTDSFGTDDAARRLARESIGVGEWLWSREGDAKAMREAETARDFLMNNPSTLLHQRIADMRADIQCELGQGHFDKAEELACGEYLRLALESREAHPIAEIKALRRYQIVVRIPKAAEYYTRSVQTLIDTPKRPSPRIAA